MKGTAQKVLILAVGTIVFVLMAGCQESATGRPTDAKKSRLVAAENIELKKELGRRSKEIEKLKELQSIEKLKELQSKEIKRQETLLAKCLEEKKLWQDKANEDIEKQVSGVLDVIMEQNSKLQEENESLKAQIDKLMAELAKGQQGEKPKE